jgi:hypothetical protein
MEKQGCDSAGFIAVVLLPIDGEGNAFSGV